MIDQTLNLPAIADTQRELLVEAILSARYSKAELVLAATYLANSPDFMREMNFRGKGQCLIPADFHAAVDVIQPYLRDLRFQARKEELRELGFIQDRGSHVTPSEVELQALFYAGWMNLKEFVRLADRPEDWEQHEGYYLFRKVQKNISTTNTQDYRKQTPQPIGNFLGSKQEKQKKPLSASEISKRLAAMSEADQKALYERVEQRLKASGIDTSKDNEHIQSYVRIALGKEIQQ